MCGNKKINLYNVWDFSNIGIVLVIGKFELRVFNGNRSDTNYLSWVKKCRKKKRAIMFPVDILPITTAHTVRALNHFLEDSLQWKKTNI